MSGGTNLPTHPSNSQRRLRSCVAWAATPLNCRHSGRVFANPRVRNVQLAGAGSTLGVWAYGVALPVYAYHAGGARAVGLLFFARFVLAALASPWLGLLADRWSRRSVMLWSDIIRCGLMAGMTAVAIVGGNAYVVYVLAITSTVVASAWGPAQAALMPSLVNTPEELTAANVVENTISSVGMFAGPALGGVLLALSGPAAVFALNGALTLWSALFVLGVPRDEPPERGRATPLHGRADGRIRGRHPPAGAAGRDRAERRDGVRRRTARGAARPDRAAAAARRQRHPRLAERRRRHRQHRRCVLRRRPRNAAPVGRRLCARALALVHPARGHRGRVLSRPGAPPDRHPRGRLRLLPGQRRDAAAALCRERGDGPGVRSPRDADPDRARDRIDRRPRSGELARHARSADCVGSIRARAGRLAVAEPAADRRRGRDRGGATQAPAEDRDLRAAAGAGARGPRGRSYCDLGRCRRRRRLARRGRQPLLCHRRGQGRSGARRRNDPGAGPR